MKIYYQDQRGWTQQQYYTLWRYLNRFFLRSEHNMKDIHEINLPICTEITKVMMYCFIKTQCKEDLLKLDNLKDLTTVKPLAEPLEVITPPTNSIKLFQKFNIIL